MKVSVRVLRVGALLCVLGSALAINIAYDEHRGQTAQGADDICINGPENLKGCPTATPTPTPTPSPTPTPTPVTPPICQFYKGTLNYLGYSASGNVNALSTNLSSTNPCLVYFKNQIRGRWGVDPDGNSCASSWDPYCDDKWAAAIAELILGTNRVVGDLPNGAHCSSLIDDIPEFDKDWHHFAGWGSHDYCREGYWYYKLDTATGTCSLAQPAEVGEICGNIDVSYIKSTPISLIWNEEGYSKDAATLVDFPLDPASANKWHVWRGSQNAPLLVYDPEHKGQVASASQLFGNWTFGGKQASVASLGNTAAAPKPWENGFEALKELDRNHDGKISGAELEPLALWFDINQDGHAQEGEVESLNSLGISSLNCQPDMLDSSAGIIAASKGYELTKNGKTVSGRTIDWYGKGAMTPGELAAENYFSSANFTPLQEQQASLEAKVDPNVKPVSGRKTLTGLWEWAIKGEDVTSGFFVIGEDAKDRIVRGYSVAFRKFAKAPGGLDSQAAATFIFGQSKAVDKGDETVKFSYYKDGALVTSEAKILDGGNQLVGRSSVPKGKEGSALAYEWAAKRAK